MAHLLIVEDDPQIRAAMRRALTDRGHVVSVADRGMSGLSAALADPPELVLLDLGLPDVDGIDVLKMLRGTSEVPVIVATARDDDASVVAALNHGADDYVTKPFSADMLNARIRAVLRRASQLRQQRPTELQVGELVITPAARTVTLAGEPLDLTPKEFEMLQYLAEREGEVVTKRELLVEIWRQPYGGAEKTVDVHLSWLRRKLGESGENPRYLATLRGVGVRLTAPEVDDAVETDPA